MWGRVVSMGWDRWGGIWAHLVLDLEPDPLERYDLIGGLKRATRVVSRW